MNLLHRLQLGYQPLIQDVGPGNEGTAVLALLKRKVDLEIGGDGYAPSRHVTGTPPQELHVFGPTGKHVFVRSPDDVVLRVLSIALWHGLLTQSIGLARFLSWRCLSCLKHTWHVLVGIHYAVPSSIFEDYSKVTRKLFFKWAWKVLVLQYWPNDYFSG